MAYIPETAEKALDRYWLFVWRNLVEAHSDYTRIGNSEYYSFKELRKHRSKESIEADVASLAEDYWHRNRSELKEYFLNMTYKEWPDSEVYEIQAASSSDNWIYCGIDPFYPNSRFEKSPYSAKFLLESGTLQSMVDQAKLKAALDYGKMIGKKFTLEEERKKKAKKRLLKRKLIHVKNFVLDFLLQETAHPFRV